MITFPIYEVEMAKTRRVEAGGQMTPEQIVDRILPKIVWTEFGNPVETEWQCKGYNQALSDIRQRLIDTYGNEWVGVEEIKDYISDVESGIKYLESSKQDYGYGKERIRAKAESILKGLRGK